MGLNPFSRNSIVHEIQSEILSDKTKVSSIIRKARVAARKLDLKQFEEWLIKESDGYKGVAAEHLPDYRKIACTPRFFNPYHGWCPIITENPQLHELLHTSYLFQPIEELENFISSNGTLTYTYPPALTQLIRSQMAMNFEIRAHVSISQISKTISGVKNILLDWAIDLEKAGITGEGLGFTAREKNEAASVTQTVYAQNIGNLGNMDGQSSVTNHLSGNHFSIEEARSSVQKIEECLPALPANIREAVRAEIQNVHSDKQMSTGKIRAALSSILRICEGATGNIAAEGIVALVRRMLG